MFNINILFLILIIEVRFPLHLINISGNCIKQIEPCIQFLKQVCYRYFNLLLFVYLCYYLLCTTSYLYFLNCQKYLVIFLPLTVKNYKNYLLLQFAILSIQCPANPVVVPSTMHLLCLLSGNKIDFCLAHGSDVTITAILLTFIFYILLLPNMVPRFIIFIDTIFNPSFV